MTDRRVVIVDDHFPTLSSGFRVSEFNELLSAGVVDEVLTTIGGFDDLLDAYRQRHPDLAASVREFSTEGLVDADLAYVMFLNNIAHHLDAFEAAGLPFVFTLYPGGGFAFDDADSDRKLARVLRSPMLRAVVTTQPAVTEYLRLHHPDAPVRAVVGPFPGPGYWVPGPGTRRILDEDVRRNGLRVCFVAHRYTPNGEDKGFPQFVEVVRMLDAAGHPVRGDVVGPFGAEDVPVASRHLFTFFGVLESSALRSFFSEQHVLVSPNRPSVLGAGAFDGFPLTSSIEASLCGVALVVSDELQQNRYYRNGRDIIIERPDPAAFVARITELLREPGGLQRLARAGLARTRTIADPRLHLEARRRIVEEARET